MNCDKILLIMSIYNEPINFIEESVDSIKNQTYENYKCIIVVDNPKLDNKINRFLDELSLLDNRFSIIYNKKNCGLASSLNIAVESQKGNDEFQYIARMDADDICKLDRLEKQINYIRLTNVDLVGCCAIKIDEDGCELGCFLLPNGQFSTRYSSNSIHPSWLMKYNVFTHIGGYRCFPSAQDYDFLCRVQNAGYKVANMKDILLYYRIRKGSIGARKKIFQRRYKFFISKHFRNKTLEFQIVPDLKGNIFVSIFNYIENRKNEKKYIKILCIISYYHLKSFYFLYRNKRDII